MVVTRGKRSRSGFISMQNSASLSSSISPDALVSLKSTLSLSGESLESDDNVRLFMEAHIITYFYFVKYGVYKAEIYFCSPCLLLSSFL